MGYTTEFEGSVSVEPPLNVHEIAYLRKFASSRRMNRGKGPFFVDGAGDYLRRPHPDILDVNSPPEGQPGLWCDWEPSEDGSAIRWNGTEKFYEGEAWMRYVIDYFLTRPADGAPHDIGHAWNWLGSAIMPAEFHYFTWDHVVNGTIAAQGEDPDDQWRLVVTDNVVTRREGH